MINKGYWRDEKSLQFGKCVPFEACLGGDENICADGYTGFKCGECVSGYTHKNGKCRSKLNFIFS